MKKIVVNHSYNYKTNKKVKVGSIVKLLTPPWLADVKGEFWEGVVTSLNSDYNGTCLDIADVVKY